VQRNVLDTDAAALSYKGRLRALLAARPTGNEICVTFVTVAVRSRRAMASPQTEPAVQALLEDLAQTVADALDAAAPRGPVARFWLFLALDIGGQAGPAQIRAQECSGFGPRITIVRHGSEFSSWYRCRQVRRLCGRRCTPRSHCAGVLPGLFKYFAYLTYA
jgi:hypothetical protein